MLLLIFEAFCEITGDHFACHRGRCAWAGEWYQPSPDPSVTGRVGYTLHQGQAQEKLLLFSEAELANHPNPQLKKPVEFIYLCDLSYASFVPCNIFLVYLVVFCLQLMYLVSVLGNWLYSSGTELLNI